MVFGMPLKYFSNTKYNMSDPVHKGSGRHAPPPVRQAPRPRGREEVLAEPPRTGLAPDTKAPTSPALSAPDSSAEALDLAIAAKLSIKGYELICKLGEGGMGNVFLAREASLDREVAIKAMNPDMFANMSARERFAREARALGRLNHPNIATVYAFINDTESGYAFIVQEHLRGTDMIGILQRDGPLAPKRFRRLFSQACDGLAAAHEAGIIHRDVKPDNIFIVKNGKENVKIFDFGIAKVEDGREGAACRTQVGTIMGTPEYMSPEQAEGREVDARADVYSLGVVMYEMVTGSTPFVPEEAHTNTPQAAFGELYRRIINEVPQPPSERSPEYGIPKEIDAIIMRCLEKEPEKRYQSMHELGAALDALPAKLKRRPTDPLMRIRKGGESDAPKPPVEPGAKATGTGQTPSAWEESRTTPPRTARKVGRKTTLIAAAATAVAVLGGAAAYYVAGGNAQVPGSPAESAGAEHGDAPGAAAAHQPKEAPATAPEARDGAKEAALPKEYKISLYTTQEGVRVLADEVQICVAGPARECSFRMEEGTDPKVITFTKTGFMDARRTVSPDSDQEIRVTLERPPERRQHAPQPNPERRRPGKKQGAQGGPVPFKVESNIK